MLKKGKTTLVGLLIILVAALLLLLAILTPRILAKRHLSEVAKGFAAADPQYLLLTDPHYNNAGLLAVNGKEVQPDAQESEAVLEALAALSGDCRVSRCVAGGIAGIDLRLLVKTAAGESFQIYFTREEFYTIKNNKVFYFTAKDAEAYAAFLLLLDSVLE